MKIFIFLLLQASLILQTSHGFTTSQPTRHDGPLQQRTTTPPAVIMSMSKGSARFTGVDDATSGLDFVLSAIVSDVGSIALGLIGLLVVMGHRLAYQDSLTADMLGQETRSDLLGVFACGAVLLNGVSKLDVTSALAESVVLEGVSLERPEGNSSSDDVIWAIESVLTATPAKTAVLLEYDSSSDNWKSRVVGGVVPLEEELRLGPANSVNPILNRFLKEGAKESYLPTLQALPGRVEFTYMPPNTQEALLLPVKSEPSPAVLVLGSNTAKSFAPRDVAWSQVLATRLGTFL